MRVSVLAISLISLSATASAAEDELIFKGPSHFCGYQFAIDVAADEQVGWKQPVHDFVLYSLQSERGGFGVYEGNFPQTFRNERIEIKLKSFPKIERLKDEEGGFSYLIQTTAKWPRFIHLYGEVWKGDSRDFPLLSRVKVGDPKKIGCKAPTQRIQQDRS